MNKLMQGLTIILILSFILMPVFAKPIEKPDLVVRDISIIRGDNGILLIVILVKNQGKADVLNSLDTEIEVETPSGNKFGFGSAAFMCTPQPCVLLGAGMNKTIIIGLSSPSNNYEKGIYRINAVVDPRNRIDEVSEGNNKRFKAVNVM